MDLKYKIPPSALVRMAIDFLKPKLSNHGGTDEGILNIYRNKFY